jgi:carboxylate-amine ligase
VRLHPRYGTVEVREMDAQASPDDVAALAALVRALVLESRDAHPGREVPSEVLGWSSFRAARDGIAATLVDEGQLRPVPEIARATIERLRPIARDLGDEDALAGVERIVREGGGAARQRAAFATGGMDDLLRMLVDRTSARPRLRQERARA